MLCFSKIWLDFDIEKEAVVLIGNDTLKLIYIILYNLKLYSLLILHIKYFLISMI